MGGMNRYFNPFLKVALGAGAVVGGAYVLSRIKDKRDSETRLERVEQIVEQILTPAETRTEPDAAKATEE
ncbi:MAG: hypothetical protein HYX75_23185 [Acidobacteria bacterium]|nr:hypothetical protein [Acidobacteriota bacterium]